MLPLIAMLLALPRPPAPVVVWVGGGNGLYDLTISGDGTVTYAEKAGKWNPSPKAPVVSHVPDTRLVTLRQLLEASRACKLEGTKRLPVPEETSTTLHLDFPGLRCTVEMLSNDWSRTPESRAVSEALGKLAEEVRISKQ